MSRTWIVIFGLLVACGGDDEERLTSSDIRLDGAGDADSVDSEGTRMCVNSAGNTFVTWFDDRDGSSGVFLNASLNAGRDWFPAPVRVDNSSGSAFNPSIACSEDAIYVVWEDDRDGELENRNIYLNYSTDGGQSWLEEDILLDLDEDGRTMSLGPRVAVTGSDVHVSWFDSAFGAYDIFVASSTDGGASFSEPLRVDSDSPGSAYSASPVLAVNEDGGVFVAWEDSRSAGSDIFVAVSQDRGATFDQDRRLDGGDSPGAGDSFEPQLAVRGDDVYVVWHDDRNGEGRDIFLNWSGDGGSSWLAEAVRIDSDQEGFFDSLYPNLAIDAAGVAHVAWHDARTNGYDIYYRSVDGDSPAGEEVRLDVGDPAGFTNSLNARVAVGSEGQVIVAWEDRRADNEELGYDDLYYNWSADSGATWQTRDLRIDSVEAGSSFAVDLGLHIHQGEMLTAWTDGRRGNADVFFHRMAVGEEATYVAAD